MTRAAIYIRKSREEKDKPAQRLQLQREQLPAYATAQGWQVEIYDDGHASAARGKTEDLRERGRLEADIRAGKVDLILTIELSRLSRDDSLQDYVAWLHLCSVHKVRLATLTRILDPAQHSDWMLLLMEGGFSSVEMRILTARMKEGRDRAFQSGLYLGGTPPLPYIYDPVRKLPVIDPDQLALCRQIWDRAETSSIRAIMRDTGIPFSTIHRAISDQRLTFCQALRIDPQTGDTIPTLWEPCLTSEQADRIKATRTHHSKKTTAGYRLRPGGLITSLGLAWCGHCGATIQALKFWKTRNDGSRLHHYQCAGNARRHTCRQSRLWPQWLIDEIIITDLCDTLADIDQLKTYWLAGQGSDPTSQAIQILDTDHAELQAQKKRLIDAIAAGVINFTDARQKKTEIETRIQHNRIERLKLVNQRTAPDLDQLSITRPEFDQLPRDAQRDILAAALHRVDLRHGTITISYAFPLTATGNTSTTQSLPGRFLRQPR